MPATEHALPVVIVSSQPALLAKPLIQTFTISAQVQPHAIMLRVPMLSIFQELILVQHAMLDAQPVPPLLQTAKVVVLSVQPTTI